MPKYYERIESSRTAASSSRCRWLAGLYRGSFGWMDAVVAVIGVAGLAAAADSFARSSAPEGA